jgi:CRP/FNR family transcriptional regulator, cyclic AMP receptor protein
MNSDVSAIYLSEDLLDLHTGSDLLANLSENDKARVVAEGTRIDLKKGDRLFQQGETHSGVWIIESGRVRSFYSGPSGKEITLAYWSTGHFVGGPEVFGRGRHIWSANIMEESRLMFLTGNSLQKLVREVPEVAIALIEGLVAKGKAYSALIQMLGTRSVSERLQQLLLILLDHHSEETEAGFIITRTLTNEQIATVVGATRQWVTQSFENLQKKGVLSISRHQIIVHHPENLSE